MFRLTTLLALLALLAAAGDAQYGLPAGYRVASVVPASSFAVPGPIGGIEFAPNGSVLLVAGGASYTTAGLYSVPVMRDRLTHRIIGYGTARRVMQIPEADSGLQFGPRGTLFFTRYGPNGLGQIVGLTAYSAKLSSLTNSVGGLTFVPAGLPNAGQLLVSSYDLGGLYAIALRDHGSGTFTPTGATPFAAVPVGTEGIGYVPSGAFAGHMLCNNYDNKPASTLLLWIDPRTGQPLGGAATPKMTTFCTGIVGAEGLAFDPLTNDLVISTWQGTPADSLVHITGFPPPPLQLSVDRATIPLAGASARLTLDAGAHNPTRSYVIIGTTSGVAPGFSVGLVQVPLNLDGFSAAVHALLNTPLFANFAGTTDAGGQAVGTLNVPRLPAAAVGLKVDFAAALVAPLTAASNAIRVEIVR